MSKENQVNDLVLPGATITFVSEDEHESSDEDLNQLIVTSKNNELAANLFKWTNYIHGWQERFFVLKNGILSYYRNQLDTQFGCRGALTLKQSTVLPHDLDECRFDIRVNDCVWYLRAQTSEERHKWIQALEEHRSHESGYGSQSSLKRHGSLLSLNSVASLSCASSSSFKRTHNLKEKLAEMETFKDILCKQVETLQAYFDACANSVTKGYEPYNKNTSEYEDHDDDDVLNEQQQQQHQQQQLSSTHIQDHAAMSIDFKGEAFTFKATAMGILTNLSHCIDLMYQSDETWRRKYEKEIEKRKKLEDSYKQKLKEKANALLLLSNNNMNGAGYQGTPDFEEGPHSALKEEQFFDAIDNTLDNLELEEERRFEAKQNLENLKSLRISNQIEIKKQHRLSEIIERVVQDHLKYDRQELTDIWELFASDGEMKLYRREVEENGIVLDPLKAVHTVKGVTGHEVCHYFWDPAYRMEWELTLDSAQVIETVDSNTLIFHQMHKRVWPAAQRDVCFWSHIRSISNHDDEQPDWIVCNYSTEHESAVIKEPILRAILDIAMSCQTLIVNPPRDKSEITREHLVCKITYVSQVNPGGWLPAAALRAVFKREYPKFLKRFTQYVIDQTLKKPIMF